MAQIRFGRNYAFSRHSLPSPTIVNFRWFVGKRPFPPIRGFRERHETRFARIDPRRRPGVGQRPGWLEQKCSLRTSDQFQHLQHATADLWRNLVENTPIFRVRDYPRNVRTADDFIAESIFFSDG
jgi:hypothetical protein